MFVFENMTPAELRQVAKSGHMDQLVASIAVCGNMSRKDSKTSLNRAKQTNANNMSYII